MYGLQARSAARESIGASAAACAPRLRATAAPPNARIVGRLGGRLRAERARDRQAAERADVPRPPDLREAEEDPERRQRAGDVGQVRAEEHGDRPLARDVRQRSDDRERPAFLHALPAAHQIDQDPRRQQRQHRDDVADRGGEREERQAGDGREREDRRPERAVGDRRVIRERRDADGVEVRDAEPDENRRDHRPRITEADGALEQRAERPREHQRLNANVGGRVVDEPGLEPIEIAREDKRVEDHQAPECDPIHRPDALKAAVRVGAEHQRRRRAPDPYAQRRGD